MAIGLAFLLGGKRKFGCVFEIFVGSSNELELLLKTHLTLHKHTSNHNIALVDQGGTRPTFGCVLNVVEYL